MPVELCSLTEVCSFQYHSPGSIAELITGTGWIQADEGADSVAVCFIASKSLRVYEDGDQRCKFGSIFF